MNFRTELTINQSDFLINHDQKIVSFGSCFAEEMATHLLDLKFNVLANPFGILFHPLAIENALQRIQAKTLYVEEEISNLDELFFSWDHHSSFNSISAEKTVQNVNNALIKAHDFLTNADVIFITLGTSWVYKIKELNLVVANCHKVPAKHFDKVLLTEQQIKTSLHNSLDMITEMAPNATIIVTVSPVRHLKDGMIENNVSKAKLLSALYEVTMNFDQVNYFPSYELMMDDLRDYRFYADDLLHPNKQAVNYIWEKFASAYFTPETQRINKQIEKITTAINHRPFNEESISHQKFISNCIKQMQDLTDTNPNLDYQKEIEHFKSKLNHVN